MARPRFLRSLVGDRSAARSEAPPPVDAARAEERRAFADTHGWSYAEGHQAAIQGWPRTALPPGPLGRVRHEITGRRRGRPFRIFDYVHHGAAGAPWQRIEVCAVALPVPVPYVYIRGVHGAEGDEDVYAESRDSAFAVELLSESLREDLRRYGLTDLVLDRDVLICTSDGGGPRDPESKIEALTEIVERVPADVWARWGDA
ncbi:type III secretion system chaperone family protein [Streptomonospora wellingtoniae]|uniref:Uncharacterized protein n=1 Tax=Streptomonospora wellingtoniae TaxID=3075544 RepID=A0ABU2KZ45_9ACTN|nr:hypothetical protein [Streptomonospora sp. DSM 45055]MDT0304576.1 hypothetical protein [Streptomonospora sp. DSM 45055]